MTTTSTTFQSTTCSRCCGTGVMPHPHVHEGKCFRCNGTGRQHTQIGYRAYLYAKAIKAKSPRMPVEQAVAMALDFQAFLLMKQAFLPAGAGVPEEKAPKPRKQRSKKQPEQAAA